jgi:hypothetical protein
MSFADRATEEDERKHRAAIVIGARKSVLRRCKFGICNALTWDESEEQLQPAYQYAAWLFKNQDPLTQDFETQKEITDLIKNLWNDFGAQCVCEQFIAED